MSKQAVVKKEVKVRKTISEFGLRQLVESGKTHAQIAEGLGFSSTMIASACSVLGIKPSEKTKLARRLAFNERTIAALQKKADDLRMQLLKAD